MRCPFLALLVLTATACLLSSCGTMSTDYAPGGINASETGMSVGAVTQWQDQTIRQLAY